MADLLVVLGTLAAFILLRGLAAALGRL